MKRIGHLYEKITDIDNCKRAIVNASKHKGKRKEVQEVLVHLDEYAIDLSFRLKELNFVSPYKKKTISDGLSGKQRDLEIPKFYPDQCAHHAIVQIIKPIIERNSCHWSCANIPKRGIDRACIGVQRATLHDKKHAKYCVKMDIRHFYPSVSHDRLKERLRQLIKDERALQILYTVIDSFSPGIPIGNYTSPWFAEALLQPLDMFIKQELGIRYYVRYADDMVLIDSNKRKLRKAMYAVIQYVSNLGMEIKHDYQLFRIYRNGKGRKIDFVGRCFAIGFTTIRKRRALALMRQSRQIQKKQAKGEPIPFRTAAGFISRCSCFKHTQSYAMRKKYMETVDINQLKEVIRNESKRKLIARNGNGGEVYYSGQIAC